MLYTSNQIGGETGIRTLAQLSPPTGFQDRTLQPLGYFSVYLVDQENYDIPTNPL